MHERLVRESEKKRLMGLFNTLLDFFGEQRWWPAKTKFEVVIGAILTQNTSWTQVEKALIQLRKHKLLDPESICNESLDSIAESIKPAGYFNQKAAYLKEFCSHLRDQYNYSLNSMLTKELPVLRQELLSLNGFGPETADSIILYAANKPVFVIDAYTKRIMKRLGLTEEQSYSGLQDFFHSNLPKNAKLFNEFHALLVALAKNYCLKKEPLCIKCPVRLQCSKLMD